MPYKNKEDKNRNSREWKEKNKDKCKAYQGKQKGTVRYKETHKRWYENNRKYQLQLSKKWRQEHPERTWAIRTRTKHRKRGYTVEITTNELEKLAKNTKICMYCDSELIYEPLRRKTENEKPSVDRTNNEKTLHKENIQIICTKCNVTKQDRTHEEFITYCKKVVKKFDVERSDRK